MFDSIIRKKMKFENFENRNFYIRLFVHFCRLELDMKKKVCRRVSPKKVESVAKQYQKVLNKSIEQMSAMFDNFNDEQWEEVSLR